MTGSIIKRGDKTYLLRLSLGKDAVTGKRLYHTETVHGTKKEAELRLRALVGTYERGQLVARSSGSVNQLLEQWLASARGSIRGRTHEDYTGVWERYVKEDKIGRLPLDKLTVIHIQGLYSRMLDRGLSPLTIRRLHTVVNQALRQGVKWRMLGHNPAADVNLPANRGKKFLRAMTLEQAKAFLKAVEGQRWGSVLSFALRTGMRPEEYLGLQWPEVDLERGLVRVIQVLVRPKGGGWNFEEPKTSGSRRTVALHARDVEELRAHRVQQVQERLFAGDKWQSQWDFVFTNESGGPVFEGNLTKRAFKPALERAGLSSSFRLYDLRHTCATLLLLAGEHPKVVSERLGHSSISITLDTYSHVLPTMQAGAAAKLADMLEAAPALGAEPAERGTVVPLRRRAESPGL